jgi:hypothetical protein
MRRRLCEYIDECSLSTTTSGTSYLFAGRSFYIRRGLDGAGVHGVEDRDRLAQSTGYPLDVIRVGLKYSDADGELGASPLAEEVVI